ncbi:N-methyl-L-tryptophan oxidase [Blastopirellula marina]|uniref:N-methyl-L-tryptophan oxidase n=1 Tax=Blastopirellula marina TaxID=124 RepID=A0A2S8GB10_9BACT|nr:MULTISPECIES: N-methyl-L-tryptophan oxidase [Pirellulaceae]PQO41284.1 N-methyl-L-tryptophan oxidase [Blastopirellula marina]RCS56308.1 N-methyl-L-tryptophan oxidase [Bremerella cremea]
MLTCDVAVVGTGGVGSAAVAYLARAGANVIGLDRYSPPHNHGSSHGQTRVIRMAYFEHPDYVPLLRHAYREWHDLEQTTGRKLYFPTGVLQIGPEAGEVIAGTLRSAQQHQLAIQRYAFDDITREFPGVVPPEACVGILERDAGYLLVAECISAYLDQARQHGAILKNDTPIKSWTRNEDTFELQTADEVIHAKQLVICGGAWATQLLADLNVPMTILRKHLYWYANDAAAYTQASSFPVFLIETLGGIYYGFPQIDRQGVKLARHDGGEPIASAQQQSQQEDAADRASVETFTRNHLPLLSQDLVHHEACMYTVTPDQHFLVGTHPEHDGLHFVAGLSGHGFKFASALGQILCDLAMTGQTSVPIDFLSPRRFF